ncbi:hypothetical protein I6I73_08180 [Corynebacterium striatum]|uniref:hypothetical protein n=1 Tax=Corynebacterium striatum TaxID=43770 RepID=UPI00191D85B2|nr:hypothetical protein [Corynebacterium striatum]QQU78756.1 hypothetical protein I6I73_08180 [Corynebacterium striatum]
MSDRYKPMGLELLPSKHYHVKRPDRAAGVVWIFKTANGICPVKSDDSLILTTTAKKMFDLVDLEVGGAMQDFLIACAESDVPIEEAKRRFLEHFGDPDLIVEAADVNDVSPEVRSALGADESMK